MTIISSCQERKPKAQVLIIPVRCYACPCLQFTHIGFAGLFFGVPSYSARPYSNCEKHSLALALETMVIVKAFHPTQHAVQRLHRKTLVNHEYSNILVVLERGKQQT